MTPRLMLTLLWLKSVFLWLIMAPLQILYLLPHSQVVRWKALFVQNFEQNLSKMSLIIYAHCVKHIDIPISSTINNSSHMVAAQRRHQK